MQHKIEGILRISEWWDVTVVTESLDYSLLVKNGKMFYHCYQQRFFSMLIIGIESSIEWHAKEHKILPFFYNLLNHIEKKYMQTEKK